MAQNRIYIGKTGILVRRRQWKKLETPFHPVGPAFFLFFLCRVSLALSLSFASVIPNCSLIVSLFYLFVLFFLFLPDSPYFSVFPAKLAFPCFSSFCPKLWLGRFSRISTVESDKTLHGARGGLFVASRRAAGTGRKDPTRRQSISAVACCELWSFMCRTSKGSREQESPLLKP